MSQRFCLISDGDGHHWLCPVERTSEAAAIVEANENFDWSHIKDDEEPPPNPDSIGWLTRIDNPTRLSFTDPKEDL